MFEVKKEEIEINLYSEITLVVEMIQDLLLEKVHQLLKKEKNSEDYLDKVTWVVIG